MSRIVLKPLRPDPLFSFAIFADIHMRGDEKYRARRMRKALLSVASSKYLDALVTAGDNTDHGKEEHYRLLEEVFAERHLPPTVLCLGNHDLWTPGEDGKDDYDKAIDLFKEYGTRITGEKIDAPYFRRDVRGYTFLCMGSEGTGVDACIGNQQIDWLDKELASLPSDKPVFVVSHYALNKTHGLPMTFGDKDYDDMTGGFGFESDRINAVLQKHKNVIIFSGHSHMGFAKKKTYSTFEKVGNIHSVNLPCFMFFNHDGVFNSGCAMIVEVYPDEIVFRGRNYLYKIWYKRFTFRLKTTDMK